ncbi:hypothetical protein F4678DRAFT_405526 [Xylaria arbuscula]|nr:hypothetical protein F4678DRAFT_405526 [Xylaria arbuscula]
MKCLTAYFKCLAALFKFPAASDTSPVPVTTQSDLSRRAEQHKHRQCRLENLPPELRHHVLSDLDIPQLTALIHASPTFYQQYLSDRRRLLCSSLEQTLGSATVDAYAIQLFAAQETDIDQIITRFLDSYGANLSRGCLPLIDELTEENALSMVELYTHSVKPLIDCCARWMLESLSEEATKYASDHTVFSDHKGSLVLSRTETVRLARAAYRFELLSRVTAVDKRTDRTLSLNKYLKAFLNKLEPWEVEELVSFYQFAESQYDIIFNDIRWDLHPDNPRFADQDRLPTPLGAFDMESDFDRERYREGATIRGLSLLRTVLFGIRDHEHLVSLMQENITRSYIPFEPDDGVLDTTEQSRRRRNNPTLRDRMHESRVRFPFRGDDEPGSPPLAWTVIWGGTYSSMYGWYIPDELRRWGYVFWDAVRLESTGGSEVLKKQWQGRWHDLDPRDSRW